MLFSLSLPYILHSLCDRVLFLNKREEIFKIFLLRYQSNVGDDNFSLIPGSQVTIVLFTESRSAQDRPRTVCCELISQFVRLYLLNPVILLISSLAAINNEMRSRVIKWDIVSINQEEELQKEREGQLSG